MVPSLLPAFSPPNAVRVLPSCLASSGVTLAWAVAAAASAAARMVFLKIFMVWSRSESGFEGHCNKAAVFQQRHQAGAGRDRAVDRVGRQRAEEVDIFHVDAVFLVQVQAQARAVV